MQGFVVLVLLMTRTACSVQPAARRNPARISKFALLVTPRSITPTAMPPPVRQPTTTVSPLSSPFDASYWYHPNIHNWGNSLTEASNSARSDCFSFHRMVVHSRARRLVPCILLPNGDSSDRPYVLLGRRRAQSGAQLLLSTGRKRPRPVLWHWYSMRSSKQATSGTLPSRANGCSMVGC